MTRLRAFFVPLLVVVFGIVGAVAASAGSASQGTQIDVTVPSSISMTGLAASYSITIPSGTTGVLNTGLVTIITNNGNGYTLKVAASGQNFVGANPVDMLDISFDTLAACDASFTTCVSVGALTTAGTTVKTTSVPTAGDVIGVRQSINVPGSVSADTYAVTETFTATANP